MSSQDPQSGPSNAPVTEGDACHIQIEERGREGDPIGYVDGFVIIVADADLEGWTTVEIREVHNSFAVATVVDETS